MVPLWDSKGFGHPEKRNKIPLLIFHYLNILLKRKYCKREKRVLLWAFRINKRGEYGKVDSLVGEE